MVDQALKSHIEILSDSYSVKEQIKKNYAIKCVEDMKKGVLIVPAIRQLLKITRGMVKQQFNKNDKVVLSVQHKKLITHRDLRTEHVSHHTLSMLYLHCRLMATLVLNILFLKYDIYGLTVFLIR